MQRCDQFVGERLRAFRLGEDAGPYRMAIDLREAAPDETPLTLRLVPADADTGTRLYRLRARLAAQMGIGIATPDTYGFHITLGYTIDWLSPAENRAFRQMLAGWKQAVARRAPVITLGAPEYCTLDDMFHFARRFYLE